MVGFTLFLLGLLVYIFSKQPKDFSLHNSRFTRLIYGLNFKMVWLQFIKEMCVGRPLYIVSTLIYRITKLIMGERDRRRLPKSRLFFLSTRFVLLLLFTLLYYTAQSMLLNSLCGSPYPFLYYVLCIMSTVMLYTSCIRCLKVGRLFSKYVITKGLSTKLPWVSH